MRQHPGGLFLRSDGTHSKTTVLLSDYPAISLLACRVRGFFCVYRIHVHFRVCKLVVPSASPRPPRSQPARSACGACMLCKFNDPAYIARCWISSERAASKHCRRQAACLLSTIGWLIGDHMTRARVPTCAKVFAVAYLSTVGVFWYVRQAFLEHAAGAARPVQCRDTLVWDNLDLQMEVFEK